MALNGLRVAQLKHAAFLTGLPSTGRRTDIVSTLQGHLSPGESRSSGSRIVSVDMGIRNLAYCVVDVPEVDESNGASDVCRMLRVAEWKKTDLLRGIGPPPQQTSDLDELKPAATKASQRRQRDITNTALASAFTPSVLSQTAYKITKDLLICKPDTILIERQRFRSGGAAAIQEWTVRVNMLESMLWACLQTIRQTSGTSGQPFPAIHAVNPARVAKFWAPNPALDLRPSADMFTSGSKDHDSSPKSESVRKRLQKKDKIAIVRSWLNGSADVSVTFEGSAAKVASAFAAPTRKRTRGAHVDAQEGLGKLDDLADCLLQATAWARWEENKHAMTKLLSTQAR